MRKLSLITYLLIGAIGCLWANNTTPASIITYSVEASPFSTDFGNNFAYYHVNLDLGDLTRVTKNGKLRVVIDFQRGMEIAETRFEEKPNGTIYYVTDLTTPIYNATVTDLAGNILLQKTYGGEERIVDYGRTLNYMESELAEKWLSEKDQFLQRIEFQNLDFVDFEIDLIELLENNPIVSPLTNNPAKKRTTSVVTTPKKVPTNEVMEEEVEMPTNEVMEEEVEMPINEVMEEDVEAATNEVIEEVNIPTNERIEEEMEAATNEVMEEEMEVAEPINEAAAAKEEEVLNDPFGELNEPLVNEAGTADEAAAPAAPIDYEESAQAEKDKEARTAKTPLDAPESLTPVLSDRRNIVKLNLPNLAFGNITLNYERILSARNSVALNLGFVPTQNPTSILSDAFNVDETVTPAQFSSITATGEYRFYSRKKGAGRGFYFAPYARYANHELAFDATIQDNFSRVATELSAIGLGGQIGMQWLIKDRIAIDWGIVGLAAQWYTLKINYTSPLGEDLNFEAIRADLEAEIEDSPLNNKLEFTTTDDSLQAKMPFLFGGARTYLSVGYKF